MQTDTIYLIVGPSGSGKDAIVDRLVAEYGLKRIDSYTTRKSRGPGDRHIFVDDFIDWKETHPGERVVGFTYFNGHDYWATQSQVEESDLYIIDPDGVAFFMDNYLGRKKVRVVWISVPPLTRLNRMISRGDGVFKAVGRLMHDRKVFRDPIYPAHFVLDNTDTLQAALDKLWDYMGESQNKEAIV